MLGPATPTKTQNAIDFLGKRFGHSIANRREIRNQSDVPKHKRHREVSRDGEYVPQKRAVEVHPQRSKLVGQGQHPVAHPNPAHVDAWKYRRHDHGKDGHGLSRAVDGHPPLLAEEQEHRRNQRSGVTNPDPPHEVGDVPGPVDRLVQSPHSNSCAEQVQDASHAVERNDAGDGNHDFPPERGGSHDRPHNVISDVLVGLVPQNQGLANGCFSLHDEGIRLR
jgi:hypothetical protein